MNTDILNDIKTEIQFIKREMVNRVALVLVGLALGAPSLQAQGSGRQMTVPVSKEHLLDMGSYANPLPATDELWIERLTELEVRDAIRAGKTSVLIPTGSVENNGPWLTMNKHNDVLRVCADSVARRMGNMLVAPIIPFEAGDPNRNTAGGISLSPAIYNGVLKDVAISLRAQGFKNIFFVGDSDGNHNPDIKAVGELMAEWQGSGVRAFYVPEFHGYDEILLHQNEVMGVKEIRYKDRFHDNYYISTMIMVGDPKAVNYSERVRIGKATINGFDLAPLEKSLYHGRQLIEFRTDATVAGIRKLIGTPTSEQK